MYLVKMGQPHYDTFAMLRQTHLLLDKLLNRRYQRFGLTMTSVELLYTVMQGPKPMSAYMLARILGREHHSVVELVNRLKKRGLIRRTTVDGRPSLELTKNARDIINQMSSTPQVIIPTFAQCSEEDLEALQEALMPIRQAAMRGLGLADMGEMRIPAITSTWP